MRARGLEDYKELLSSKEGSSFFEELVAPDLGDLVWVPNPGPQTEAYFSPADEVFYGGQAGGGKLQKSESLILTPTGWRKIGSLKVGDKLCATDSTVQEVIGVFPQGDKELYRVRMRDGGQVDVGLEHNWLAWRTHANTKKGNKITCGEESARKWTTAQMMAEIAKGRRKDGRVRAFAIPVAQPVHFNVAGQLKGRGVFIGRELSPYILGVLLGDGHMTSNGVGITSVDEEIVSEFYAVFGEVTKSGINHNLRGTTLKIISDRLSDLDLLGKKSHDKFIPRQYLFAPTEERWALLQGLMDTDGWVEPKRACYYVTISSRLADDVEHLARSLGAVTTRTEKAPSYEHKGEKLKGQKAYCIRIKLPNPEMAFRLPRKKEVAADIEHQSAGRVIESITPTGEVADCVCIAVSNANSLYITEDFIVTHNTDLEIGLALTQHRSSLILRRTNREVGGLVERMSEILKTRDGFNSQTGKWRYGDRVIELGGCQLEEDKQKYKGVARDLYCFDEVSDFTQTQYEFIIGWNRSANPAQRCRVVAAGNPPTRPEGIWVLKRWAAWLDPTNYRGRPAEPGELRWYTTDPSSGEEIEVDGPGPHLIAGEYVHARSRTFIPATLNDNPDLRETNYQASLDSLPAELRAAYRDGNFSTVLADDPYQIIPTEWVTAAQSRWEPRPPVGIPMCAIGADIAIKKDFFVLAPRHDSWFAPLVKIKGQDTADPKQMAGNIMAVRRDGALVIVDAGGGWGTDCYGHLIANGIDAVSYMGVKATHKKDKDNKFKFANVRTEALWRMREALDPSQPGGSQIALPPSSSLKADLCAPSYSVKGQGADAVIVAESKEKVKERLGRSTDEGDAVIMSWYKGLKQHNIAGGWADLDRNKRMPVVNRGRRYT